MSEIRRDARANGVRWFSLGGGQELHLISHEYYKVNDVKTNKAVHLALTSDRFDKFLKVLDDAGIAYGNWRGEAKNIETRSDGAKQVFFQDPDGYWIELNDVGRELIGSARAADDMAAIKQAVADYYATFYVESNKQKYRTLLTEDYALLENGDLLDIEGDLALMPTPESSYKRTDAFDFRSVKIQGDIAYAIYLLKSEITDKNGIRNREWLESAIFRRASNRWLMALLHSTRITKPRE